MLLPDDVVTTTLLCLEAKGLHRDVSEIIMKFTKHMAKVPFHKKPTHMELLRRRAKLDISTRVDARPSPYERLPPVLFADEYELFRRHFAKRITNNEHDVPVRFYVMNNGAPVFTVLRMRTDAVLDAVLKIT